MKTNNKLLGRILTTLNTNRYVRIMFFFCVFSVYESAQNFSFTTSPHFLWIVGLQGCTSSFYVYRKNNLYKSHDHFENIWSESLAVFIFYLVYYCRKVENKLKNPTGDCATVNLLSTL